MPVLGTDGIAHAVEEKSAGDDNVTRTNECNAGLRDRSQREQQRQGRNGKEMLEH